MTDCNAPLSSYAAMAYHVASTNANCAMLDIASNATWGGGFAGLDSAGEPVPVTDSEKATAIAAAASGGLRDPNSSHPTALGYESYKSIIREALLT